MTQTLTARDIFRAAYDNRYTWDGNFPGYTADLELKQGEAIYTGKIRVNPDLSVEVTGKASGILRKPTKKLAATICPSIGRSPIAVQTEKP